jgi:peroxiredoxin family protein
MGQVLERKNKMPEQNGFEPIRKVSIIVSKGSLDGVYPGLIMANGARMEGIEASLFFTFFGMDAIVDKKMDHIKVATVGNPGMHMPTWIGGIPGMSAFATGMMKKEMEKLDIPPVREFLEMIHDAGCEIYACKASVDMFHLKKEDFCKQVDDIISVGQFYEKSAGAQIIFT